jgi:dTDP-L-rhamnose 4-epimerase
VRDAGTVAKALRGISVVYHEAAAVGVGQSMYRIANYVSVNSLGAAVVLEGILKRRADIRKMIVASSMSIYGEGKYECSRCGVVYPQLRPRSQLQRKDWEMRCPQCAGSAKPLGTDENKPLFPTSIYAITKRDHEEMFLSIGRAYKIPTVALRYFNVYGPRQALSNPYTGVAAIFSSRILNQNPPLIFEDGGQSRDFVHVSDIVQANLLALEKSKANYEVFNVGTGRGTSVLDVARTLSSLMGFRKPPVIVRKFREGDIRHCFADISKISKALGYRPRVNFEDGMKELVGWVRTQTATDRVEQATKELRKRGLA